MKNNILPFASNGEFSVKRNDNDSAMIYQRLLEDTVEKLKEENAYLKNVFKSSEAANNKLMESIRYARLIQNSLLPNPDEVKRYMLENFVIWMPRDILSGDLFHSELFDDGFVAAVIDCTGHGVPGAFMTMIASTAMKRIIKDEKCQSPAQTLKRLNAIVKSSLQQDTDFALSDNGMDAAICFVRSEKKLLTFAGARLPLHFIHNGEIHTIKGDRQSIGYRNSDLNFEYREHQIELEKDMIFYMLTDGFTDQFGGERNLPFGKSRFFSILKENSHETMEIQKEKLMAAFQAYKGNNERQDDVVVVGFKVKDRIFGDESDGLIDRRKSYRDRSGDRIERRRIAL
jgi:serine phosphatase RsbU (regulator of sigma subunit)